MITSNQDLMEQANDLAEKMRQNGQLQESMKIKNALSASSMPTEIIGELRIQAQSMLTSNIGYREALEEICRYINSVLK